MRKRCPRRRQPSWDHLDYAAYSRVTRPLRSRRPMASMRSPSPRPPAPGQGRRHGRDDRLDRDVPRPEYSGDRSRFDQQYGLPNITLDVINQAGTQTDNGWAQEESLDVEWAHAIAPAPTSWSWRPRRKLHDARAQNNLMTAVNTAKRRRRVSRSSR